MLRPRKDGSMGFRFGLFVVATTLMSACDGSKPDYERWALPSFEFSDMPNLGTILITGTLKGRDVGYPVNTWNIQCYRQQMICHVAEVEEIGKGQLGEIWLDDWTVPSRVWQTLSYWGSAEASFARHLPTVEARHAEGRGASSWRSQLWSACFASLSLSADTLTGSDRLPQSGSRGSRVGSRRQRMP